MVIPQQLQALQTFLESDPPPALTIAVAAGLAASPTFQRLNLATDVADSMREIPAGMLRALKNAVLRPYEVGYKPDHHEVLFSRVDAHDNVRAIVDSLSSINQLELFQAVDEVVEHLRFYVLALENQAGDMAFLFRRTGPKMELGRRFSYAAMFENGRYNKIDQKILLFDDAIDCFTWDARVYVSNVSQFNAIFDFFEQLRSRASETVDQITRQIPILNEDEFRAACTGQVQMLAKLSSIRNKPYLQTLTLNRIKQNAMQFGVSLTIAPDPRGNEALVFEPQPDRRWLILKFLDDDFLSSPMTTLKYEVNSKITL